MNRKEESNTSKRYSGCIIESIRFNDNNSNSREVYFMNTWLIKTTIEIESRKIVEWVGLNNKSRE